MAVDADGLTIKTIEEIQTDIATSQRADIDAALITTPEEPQGQLNGIYADNERQVWEGVQIAYNAFNPDAAEGFLLDALCALTGTVRLKATYTRVLATCTLTSGTQLVTDTHAAHVTDHPEWRFTPENDFTAPSTGDHSVWFRAEELGPIPANAGELEVIATPLTGWTAITNASDADEGNDEEQDASLRERREERLQAQGSGTVPSIKSAVLGVDDVINCTVYENTTDTTNSNGLPAHAIEAVVYDGSTPAADDDEIAQAIWDNKAGGIQAYGDGSASGDAIDDEGTHNVNFSRPADKDVYIELSLSGSYDSAVVKDAIVDHMQSENAPGVDVIRNEIIVAAMGAAGVTDVPTCYLGFSASPTGTVNLTIGIRSIAAYDTSRITIT
jgi:uncharacterized phage protein gp47/JayE